MIKLPINKSSDNLSESSAQSHPKSLWGWDVVLVMHISKGSTSVKEAAFSILSKAVNRQVQNNQIAHLASAKAINHKQSCGVCLNLMDARRLGDTAFFYHFTRMAHVFKNRPHPWFKPYVTSLPSSITLFGRLAFLSSSIIMLYLHNLVNIIMSEVNSSQCGKFVFVCFVLLGTGTFCLILLWVEMSEKDNLESGVTKWRAV